MLESRLDATHVAGRLGHLRGAQCSQADGVRPAINDSLGIGAPIDSPYDRLVDVIQEATTDCDMVRETEETTDPGIAGLDHAAVRAPEDLPGQRTLQGMLEHPVRGLPERALHEHLQALREGHLQEEHLCAFKADRPAHADATDVGGPAEPKDSSGREVQASRDVKEHDAGQNVEAFETGLSSAETQQPWLAG